MNTKLLIALMLVCFVSSCTSNVYNEESVHIEPTGVGTFQLMEYSCELHYAVYQRVYVYRNAYCVTFLSKDGLKKVELNVISPNGELKSGVYGMMEQTVIAEDDRLKARISLADSENLSHLELELKKDGAEYCLRLYDPEIPDSDMLTWKGKIVVSSALR